jgi:hypothetical protein
MLSSHLYRTVLLFLLLPLRSLAQTDEIEIYDAAIADKGTFDLTVHTNYTPHGPKQAAFPGGVVPNHSDNGAIEWAYGAAPFLELGLYAPVYTITNGGEIQMDGVKLRTLWVVPDAKKRAFFYGVNFEYSYNMHHWQETHTSFEMRPIFGWHLGRWDLISNPILDYDFKKISGARFAPAERISYNATQKWTFGVEHYSDVGPISGFVSSSQQYQMLFGITDYNVNDRNSFEFGIGHGFTSSSESLLLKIIYNHNL